MGEMGRATCMICGSEFPIDQMKVTFTGRTRYMCSECASAGEKQAKARMISSGARGYMKKLKEKK